jgi:hypothetical protein
MSQEVTNLIESADEADRLKREEALAAQEAILAQTENIRKRYVLAIDGLINNKIEQAAALVDRDAGANPATAAAIRGLKVTP